MVCGWNINHTVVKILACVTDCGISTSGFSDLMSMLKRSAEEKYHFYVVFAVYAFNFFVS